MIQRTKELNGGTVVEQHLHVHYYMYCTNYKYLKSDLMISPYNIRVNIMS